MVKRFMDHMVFSNYHIRILKIVLQSNELLISFLRYQSQCLTEDAAFYTVPRIIFIDRFLKSIRESRILKMRRVIGR